MRVESSCELVLWVQFSLQSQTFCLFVAKPLAFENEVLTFFFLENTSANILGSWY